MPHVLIDKALQYKPSIHQLKTFQTNRMRFLLTMRVLTTSKIQDEALMIQRYHAIPFFLILMRTPPIERIRPDNEEVGPSCSNCQRKNCNELGNLHRIEFHRVASDRMKRRKFKLFMTSNNRRTEHDLCTECKTYLTSNHKKTIEENAWPAFIWKMLTNDDVKRAYGSLAWCLIPKQWRHWYIQSIKHFEFQTYNNIEIHIPEPAITDVTADIVEFDELISTCSLPKLADACNRYMIPTVLCPFGCSEFKNKTGYVSMDLIFQIYLPKAVVELYSSRVGFSAVVNAREGFIEFQNRIESEWLLNPD